MTGNKAVVYVRPGEVRVETIDYPALELRDGPGVLNSIMEVTKAAGKLAIPGLYVTGDPGGVDEAAKHGSLSIRIGLGWARSQSLTMGQCPVMRYHRQLMHAILSGRAQIASAVNATVISLDDAPQGYTDFDRGAARKFVLDPNHLLNATSVA